jgi:hypothetical protein
MQLLLDLSNWFHVNCRHDNLSFRFKDELSTKTMRRWEYLKDFLSRLSSWLRKSLVLSQHVQGRALTASKFKLLVCLG